MPAFVTAKEILGTKTRIYVDGNGMFEVNHENEESRRNHLGRGDTLDKAVAAARSELNKRRVEVEVPFITTKGKQGIATKRHGRNNTIMARIDGKTEQVDAWNNVFKADTPREIIEEYLRLENAASASYKRRQQITRDHAVKLAQVFDKAVQEKIASDET